MQTRNLKLLAAALPVCLLAACMPMTPHLDSHFGDAVNIAKAQQIIDPDAGKKAASNPDRAVSEVRGVDGKAAQAAMENYDKSFKAPPPTTISNTISIGGGGGGGAK